MKRIFFSALLILISLLGFGQQWTSISGEQPQPIKTQLISSSEEQIIVRLQVPGFNTCEVSTPRGQAQVVTVPKTVNTLNAGEPNLPMIAIPVVIGDQANMSVKVEKVQYTDFENMEIAPSKGDFPRSVDPATVAYTYGETYQHNAFYPDVKADLYNPYILRDFRGQNIIAYPFAYNPVTKTLRVYYDMTLVMEKNGEGGENRIQTRKGNTVMIDPDFKNIYEHHFINYKQALTRYTPVDEEGEMLIICHDDFMNAMTDFIQWKHTRGIQTSMVAMSSIGSEATDIQGFVKDWYEAHPGLAYVLLVGDDAQIPGLYFSAVTTYNDWSGKGDNVFGQVAGNDLYNDVFVGRFSANTVAQLATQIERTIYYERDIDASATWLENGEGMAAYAGEYGHNSEDDFDHINLIRDDLLTYTYTTVYQDYQDVNGYTCSAASITQHINNGIGILNYANHGHEQKWAVASYCNENVNALTNDNKLPFIWSVACKVGKYDNEYTDDGAGYTVGQDNDCLAEAWMHATNSSTNAPTGAIGGMFSYISQPWQPPMYGQDEMVDILIESYPSNIKHTLGGTSINGLMAIIDQYGADDINAKSTHQGWVLYGDPSLMLHTKAPELMTVSHTGTIAPSATSYSVQVTNGDGCLATITRNYEILGTAKVINGTADITLTAPGTDYTTLTLCVFGFNRVTYLGTISVNTGSQYTITATASPAEGGTIEGAGNYYADQVCTLTATPNRGYVFAGWKQNGDIVSNNPSYSFTVQASATFTAQFTALTPYAIHCTESSQGNITIDRLTAYPGETVTIGTQPTAGYSFSSWTVIDANNSPITVTNGQFTMPDSEVTVSATYIAGYPISLAEVMYGSISANKATASQGATVTLTATPANGYQFNAWKVYRTDNINTTVTVSSNQFTMPAYPVTVSAVFTLQPGGEVSIGSGTSTLYYLPTFESYKYSLTEQLYTPAEVGGAGTISSIAFYASTTKTTTRALDIYMKNTEKTQFANTSDMENVSTLFRVFSGNVTFNGWTTINLTTPFEYDGTSNLLLVVDDHTGTGLDSYNYFYTYSTGSYRSIVAFRDGKAAYNPATANDYAGTRYSVNDQIKFTKAVNGIDESLSLSTDRLFGFRYEEEQGPSESLSFILTGANLTGSVTLTAPTDFEICLTENGSYSSSVTIAASNGQVSRMVYARLKAGLTKGIYEQETITINSGNISTQLTLTGEVTGEESPVAVTSQQSNVTAGWNWWSTYIELTDVNGLALLEEALGDNGVQIKYQNQYTSYSSSGWHGSLRSISNERMYQINMAAAGDYVISGDLANPEEHPISLNAGWNWVGYVENTTMSVDEALVNLTLGDEDILKSHTIFTTYYEGYGWFGDLETLEPGKGYMVKATNAATFTYPANAKASVSNASHSVNKFWSPNASLFPNNMNVLAVVELNGVELRSEEVELGVFAVNGECRGSAMLRYVEPIDRYVAFLTVFGEDGDALSLRVRAEGMTHNVNEQLTMMANEVIGTGRNPITLTAKGTGLDEVSAGLSLYPNPVNAGQQVRIELPENMGNATVEIIDMMGRVIYANNVGGGGDDVHIVSTPGVYTIRITGKQGQTWNKLLIIK